MLTNHLRIAVILMILALPGVMAVPLIGADPPRNATTRQTAPRPEVIRDRLGRKLGTIRPLSNGRFEARDRLQRFLGSYDPKTNLTRDRLGRVLYEGNTLSALVVCSAAAKR